MIISYITNTRSGLKIGERNQAIGVVDALCGHYPDAIMLEYDVSEGERLMRNLSQYHDVRHIIIGVSDSGVSIFRQLPPLKNYTAALIGHEVPEHMESVIGRISVLAIPSYVNNCPAAIPGMMIVRTNGVANTMTVERAEAACRDWVHRFPADTGQRFMVAMLGGSVDGVHYQPAEAANMAHYVARKARDAGAYVLASNSPRTRPEDMEAFENALAEAGCESAFFPFHMKNQNNEAPYRALVGIAARNPDSRIVITGDSVSMPCEIAQVVPPEQIYLFPVSNLNRQNRDFVEWMYQSGRAGMINTSDFTETHIPQIRKSGKMNAARQIAEAILLSIGVTNP